MSRYDDNQMYAMPSEFKVSKSSCSDSSPLSARHMFFKYQEVQQYVLSRDWVGLKWHPVLKVREQLQDKRREKMQNSYRSKPLAILMSNIAPEFHSFSHSLENCMRKFRFCSSYIFNIHKC